MSGDIPSSVPDFIDSDGDIGRTWADIAWSARRHILVIVSVAIVAILYLVFRPDLSGIGLFLEKYSDAILCFLVAFVVFLLIGRSVTRNLLHVPMMEFLVLDFDGFRGEIYRIPVPLLSMMDVGGGNNLAFTWRTGDSFKLARRVDLENGVIETAWPHEVPIEQAAFTLSDLQRREKDYEDAKIENLYLRRRPVVIASDLARRSNYELTHEISDVLNLDELDIDEYLEGLDPLKVRMEASEDFDEGGDGGGEQASE